MNKENGREIYQINGSSIFFVHVEYPEVEEDSFNLLNKDNIPCFKKVHVVNGKKGVLYVEQTPLENSDEEQLFETDFYCFSPEHIPYDITWTSKNNLTVKELQGIADRLVHTLKLKQHIANCYI